MADQEPPETSAELNLENSADAKDTVSSGEPVLPDRIRVHALAKLLGVTSKQVLAALTSLGADARSPQSSLGREVAESVRTAFASENEPETAQTEAVAPEPVAAEPAPGEVAPEVVQPEVTAPAVVVDEVVADEGPEDAGLSQPQLFASHVREDVAVVEPSLYEPAAFSQVPLFLQPEFLQPDVAAAEEARRRRRTERKSEDEPREQAATAVEETAAEPAVVDAASDLDQEADSSSDSVDTDADKTDNDKTDNDKTDDDQGDDDKAEGGQPRRRRRGRRGRGRGRGEQQGGDADDESDGSDSDEVAADSTTPGTSDDTDSDDDTDDEAKDSAESDGDSGDDSDDNGGGDGANRRRRRRRRRKVTGDGSGDEAKSEDDPPNTVVHEREPRNKGRAAAAAAKDEVQGITGSTRLEAKRQRRRDGRDAGRRRPPILTESEFLARREAVDRVMVVREKVFAGINDGSGNVAASLPVTQVAVLEDDVLVEHFVTSSGSASMVGNVYLGRVQNVLPSMEAAFVDIGRGRNGVLYAGEVNWEAAGLGGNSRKIEQALKPGDQVLVQVSKDPVGHKGARLTTQISLAGRFLVYVPGGSSTGISRKLPDTERKRLKEILRDIVPNDAGVIIRTASEGVSAAELALDVERLQSQWRAIEEQSSAAGKGNPQALYEEPDLLVKVIRDLFNEDFSKIVIEGEKAWTTVESYIKAVAADLLPRVQRHDTGGEQGNRPDVFQTYRIDEQLAKALDRKVWLPSGGTLVIDRTEAMTVVDVNTGKFTGAGGNLEETVTRNNLEAAEEIVRQMRLRDIGGMIVVDFIDMVLESNRDLVLRRLTEALGRDRTRHQVSEVTSLGLVQMTRKKLGTGLVEAFSTNCEHCHGRGILVHSYPVEVSSSDDNGSRSSSRNEQTPRKRRGREAKPTPEVVEPVAAVSAPVVSEVVASVKRAHPVALAMAAHHDHPDFEDEHGSVEAAVEVEVTPVAVEAEPDVAEPLVEQATPTEPEAPAPAAEPKKKSWVRRRVSRAAAAPAGDASVGTVFVVPTEGQPKQAELPQTMTAAVDQTPDTPIPPRAPRRRRAAARPAGPPVDVDA